MGVIVKLFDSIFWKGYAMQTIHSRNLAGNPIVNFLSLLVLACGLSTSSFAGLFGGEDAASKTVPYDFKSAPASQAKVYVELNDGKNFSGIKRLGIINFNVEFTTFKEASNSRSSSSWSQNSATGVETRTTTTHSQYKSRALPMPDQAKLQAMVDNAYQDLNSQLKALGIELIPYEQMKAMPEFGNFKNSMHSSPWVTETKDSESVFVSPTGMTLYMDNLERANAMQGISAMFENTNYQEMKMIFAMKDTALLSVNMVVDFATVEAEKGFLSSLSHQVNADMAHHLQAKNTFFRFMGYGQPNSVRVVLKKHLVSDAKFWDELPSAPTEKKEGFGALLGALSKSDDKEYMYNMDTYYDRTQEMLLAAQRMFMGELSKFHN